MAGYTKLWSDIVHSTIWREEAHVRLVWITMLALSDRNGYVGASIPGLADAARVTVEECREALSRLALPDPDSRTKEHEGRRITDAEGGWTILNYLYHREREAGERRRVQTREAVRRYRAKKEDDDVSAYSDNRKQSKRGKPMQRAEAEAEADTEKKKTSRPRGRAGTPTWLTPFLNAWTDRYHGSPPSPGRLGRALAAVYGTYGPDQTLRHWGHYLARSNGKASPEHFAQTFGEWEQATELGARDREWAAALVKAQEEERRHAADKT